MGFKVEKVQEGIFNTFKELKESTIIEKANTTFIPIKDFIDKAASFEEDNYFGFKMNWLTFNKDGFEEFCRRFKVPYDFIQKLDETNLVSKILNNHIKSEVIKKDLLNNKFVIDKAKNKIVGVVSNTYIDYSNKEFLEDIEEAYPDIFKDYEITESYIINTKLYLRLLSSKIKSGYAKGDNYEGEDISRIGLQLKNSMIGNSSIKIDYFIYRALCSNGLVVEAFNEKNKILHSGRRENFIKRLEVRLTPVIKDLPRVSKLLRELVEIEFNPYTLAKLQAGEFIYKIIPISSKEHEQRSKLKGEELIEWDKNTILKYVNNYSGELSRKVFLSSFRNNQSMFDFVNIFTEFAHSPQNTKKQRIYIEEKTGEFAAWILKNKYIIKKENIKYKENTQVSLFDYV